MPRYIYVQFSHSCKGNLFYYYKLIKLKWNANNDGGGSGIARAHGHILMNSNAFSFYSLHQVFFFFQSPNSFSHNSHIVLANGVSWLERVEGVNGVVSEIPDMCSLCYLRKWNQRRHQFDMEIFCHLGFRIRIISGRTVTLYGTGFDLRHSRAEFNAAEVKRGQFWTSTWKVWVLAVDL